MTLKAEKIWYEGKLVNWDEANVHILTHTLHYGLGVFEGIRCYKTVNGKTAVFKLKEHVERLFNSAKIVEMKIPFSQEEIFNAIVNIVKVNKIGDGYIRPISFVGETGSIGLYVKEYPVRTAVIAIPFGKYLGEEGIEKGIRVKTSSFTRYGVNTAMTRGKICGAYFNSILAKKEAVENGYDEALMLDSNGFVCEASGENIFIIKNNIFFTPPKISILPGITRDTVIEIIKEEGYEVREYPLTRDDVYIADEAFFTGTAAEITPIRELDGRSIGSGKAGKLSKYLQKKFFEYAKCENDKHIDWLTFVE
jgi:branched-chain amino acid aminotransferase